MMGNLQPRSGSRLADDGIASQHEVHEEDVRDREATSEIAYSTGWRLTPEGWLR